MNRLLLCAIVCCLFACNNLSRRLDMIEAQLWDNPENALAALLDSNLRLLDASDKDRARMALLTSIALDKNYIDITSDSIVHIALDYYRNRNDNRHKMLAWYYSGIVHKNASNIQEAVIDFEQAGKYSIETNDLFYNGLINWRMGDLFSMTNNNSQSIEYYKSAVQNFAEIDAEAYLNYAQFALAQCLANARLFHEADSLTNAIKESINDPYLENRLRLLQAQIMLELNDSSSEIQKLYDNVPLDAYEMLDYSMRGIAFERNGQPDSADVWIDLAYQHAADWADSASIDVQNAWIAHSRKNYEAAYDLLNNAIQAQDSLTRIVLQQSISTRQRDFYRNETAEKDRSLRRLHQIILLAVLATAFALSIIILLFIFTTQKKNQQLKEQMAVLLVSQRDLLQAQKDNAMLSGSLFRDKFLQLNQISAKYFDSDDENNKEVVFQTFKKNLRDLQSNETLFELLEQDLDRYCDNIMTKFKAQVPSITGQNLHILALFFSGAPYRVVQLISGAQSIEALKTKRSRFRKTILEANAADSNLFLYMLDMKKAAMGGTQMIGVDSTIHLP